MKAWIGAAAAAAVLGAGWMVGQAEEKAAAKPSIKEIMKAGFKKDAIIDKIKKNEATPAEVKQFAEYCKQLCELTPKKGPADSWKAKTAVLNDAAAAFAKDEKAVKALVEASNCKACHSVHK